MMFLLPNHFDSDEVCSSVESRFTDNVSVTVLDTSFVFKARISDFRNPNSHRGVRVWFIRDHELSVVSLVDRDEDMGLLFDIKSHDRVIRVMIWDVFVLFMSEIGVGCAGMIQFKRMIEVVFVKFADTNTFVVCDEVIDTHPEGTIISLAECWDLFLHFWSPEWRIITPVTFPFKFTPRISNLNDSSEAIFSLDFFGIEDGVSMTRNNTQRVLFFSDFCTLGVAGQEVVLSVTFSNVLPHDFRILRLQAVIRSTSEILQSVLRKTSFDDIVAAEELGIGLFKE
mmetsp:Transcript_60821/g.70587  ORF Transcript_60821/g.70587 Transcript_60821/m.70587 type:complete len:283 (+) Transcript_60821:592-1440(+)